MDTLPLMYKNKVVYKGKSCFFINRDPLLPQPLLTQNAIRCAYNLSIIVKLTY